MNNTNPLRPLEFQDNAAATQTNLRQIKQRWNQLVKHLPTAFASINTGSSNSADIAQILAELAIIEAEIAALQAATTYTLTQNVVLGSAVYEISAGNAAVASVANAATANGILGLALKAGTVGTTVQVAESGTTVTNPAWAWTVGPVYLGLNGLLTQTPQSTAGAVYVAPMGFAVSATSVLVAVGEPEFFTTQNTDAVLGRSASGQLNQQWLPLLPNMNLVPAGYTVTVPAGFVLFTGTNGLDTEGDVVLNGDAEQMTPPYTGGGGGGGIPAAAYRAFAYFMG